MKDNRLGAIALIIGAIGAIIVLTFHPGGSHHVTPAQLETLIAVDIGVHVLAIASLPFSFLGTLALSRQFDSPNRLAILALVIYGFSLAATMCAGTMSGLVMPILLRHLTSHDAADQWNMLIGYTHSLNQGFAQIGTVASCVAIILWSIAIMKRSGLPLAVGVYGLLIGVVVIGAIFSGVLNTELHGFRIITFGQSLWFIITAILLWRASEMPTPAIARC